MVFKQFSGVLLLNKQQCLIYNIILYNILLYNNILQSSVNIYNNHPYIIFHYLNRDFCDLYQNHHIFSCAFS